MMTMLISAILNFQSVHTQISVSNANLPIKIQILILPGSQICNNIHPPSRTRNQAGDNRKNKKPKHDLVL